MDPNNPGQNSGAPTPDPWAPPSAPGQPQYPQQPPAAPEWGAPPPGYDPSQQPGAQPPYGAPGQPVYGQPPYGQQPYGQPAWGVAAPVKKSRLPKIIMTVVGVVVVIFVGLVVVGMLLPSHASKVVFTSDAPTSDGAKSCKLGTEVTTVKLGDPVYVNIFYKERLSNETVTITILKDGAKLDSLPPLPSAESNGIDCLEDQSNWGDILSNQGAGSYEFKLTDSKGNVVSDGTLTVTK